MIRNRSFGLFWLCALLSVPDSIAQSGWATTQTGQTEFSSKAAGPARDIYAIDKTGEVKLNLSDGRIEAKITMKRSEERRVGKECRSRRAPYSYKNMRETKRR